MARGRPRKLGVPRDPRTGRIASGFDRQPPEAITAVAEEARVRQLLGVDAWKTARRNEKALQEARRRVSNPLIWCALGRFLYGREIDQSQYDAGIWYAELYRDIAILDGAPCPNIPALDYGAIPGRSTSPDKNAAWVDRRREQWGRVQEAIRAAHGDHGRTTRQINNLLDRVIVRDIGPQNAYELGNLRVGLNAVNQARGV